MSNHEPRPHFNSLEINMVFDSLTSTDKSLKERFDIYITEEYKDQPVSRLYYLDMAEISQFIVEKVKLKQDKIIKDLFIQIEHVLKNCDSDVENIIVVGLLEGIQNIGGTEIDYYYGFDNWLLPISKIKWDGLIDFWEGIEWRDKKPQ